MARKTASSITPISVTGTRLVLGKGLFIPLTIAIGVSYPGFLVEYNATFAANWLLQSCILFPCCTTRMLPSSRVRAFGSAPDVHGVASPDIITTLA